MKKYLVHVIWVVVAVVAFVGGIYYGKAGATASRGNFAGFTSSTSARGGFAGRTGTAAGVGIVAGQIISVSPNSLTLQLANGNSQVVFYSSSTQVEKPQPVPADSLASGTEVMVGGTQNSDGSLTAQTIQVRPAGSAAGFPGAGAGSSGASGT